MKKIIRLWYSYDFANSFASIVLIFYYPLILSERGVSDAWIGISTSVATGILLIILPFLGNHSDKTSQRIYFIRFASACMVLSLIAIAFVAQYNSQNFSIAILFVLSFLYILFQVTFQGSYVFYSAMLRAITSNDSNAKVSGVGYAFGQLGNALALGIVGPIIGSSLIIIGFQGKSLALCVGGVLFALMSAPFLLQKETKKMPATKVRFSYKVFIKQLFSNKRIALFLVGYALLADTILTFQLYIAIYIKKVFSFSDQYVAYAGIAGLLGGIFGGFVASTFAKKLKNEERALQIASIAYACCFGLCALMPSIALFVFAGLVVSGIAYGLVFSLARTVYSKIAGDDTQAEFFSVFTVFERAASVIGPLVWLATFYGLRKFGEHIQYRGSVFFLMFICAIGVYFLKKSQHLSKVAA